MYIYIVIVIGGVLKDEGFVSILIRFGSCRHVSVCSRIMYESAQVIRIACMHISNMVYVKTVYIYPCI